MKRQEFDEENFCGVDATLTLIGGKWKFPILFTLIKYGETLRFGELLERVKGDISQKILTEQLRELEQSGFVERKIYAEVPARVEYTITPFGKSLLPIFDEMMRWGNNNKSEILLNHSQNKKQAALI